MICIGEYYEYSEALSHTFQPQWITGTCALVNLILSIRIFKRRRQIEKEEKAHQPTSKFNNKIPKSLESILLNSFFLVFIPCGGRLTFFSRISFLFRDGKNCFIMYYFFQVWHFFWWIRKILTNFLMTCYLFICITYSCFSSLLYCVFKLFWNIMKTWLGSISDIFQSILS